MASEADKIAVIEKIKLDLLSDYKIGAVVSAARQKKPVSEEEGKKLSEKHFNKVVIKVLEAE